MKAFTLLELLVTVSIVSTLAAISLANYEEYKQHAITAATKVAIHDVATATELINADNVYSDLQYAIVEMLPDGTTSGFVNPGTNTWQQALVNLMPTAISSNYNMYFLIDINQGVCPTPPCSTA